MQAFGFPAAWEELREAGRSGVITLLRNWRMDRNRKILPPVVIEQGPKPDYSLNCVPVGHGPFEFSLFKDASAFSGLILINPGHTEKELLEAFRRESRKHCPGSRGGGSAKWQAKLNDLAVLRIWGRFPDDPNRRVAEIVALPDWKERQKAKHEKREVDSRISSAAVAEMSRACARARAFFRFFFPGKNRSSYSSCRIVRLGLTSSPLWPLAVLTDTR